MSGRNTLMSGLHLCLAHQGNTSHYAEYNCEFCALVRELDDARRAIAAICHQGGGECYVKYESLIAADDGVLAHTFDPATRQRQYTFTKNAKRAAP